MTKIVAVYPNGEEVTFSKHIVGGNFMLKGRRPYKFVIPENLHPSEVHYLYGYVTYRRGDIERLEVVKEIK